MSDLPALATGDPRRLAIRRAVFGTLWSAAVFFLFTVPVKQIKPLYGHAPWLNDPYDTLYSFAMFFVPLTAAYLLPQVSLCLRAEPASVRRLRSILRACGVAAALMAATVLACWIAVADEANRQAWTLQATAPLVAGLVATTAIVTWSAAALLRAPRLTEPAGGGAGDWLGDAVAVADRESRWLGPLRPAMRRAVCWADHTIVSRVRRHPVWTAGAASAGFGLAVGMNQALREHYYASSALLTIGLLTCGMFAFLMIAGSYLAVISAPARMPAVPRRAVDALVASCVAALITLAFRNSLWWLVGANANGARNGQFALLAGAAMALTFVVTWTTESAVHAHARMRA